MRRNWSFDLLGSTGGDIRALGFVRRLQRFKPKIAENGKVGESKSGGEIS